MADAGITKPSRGGLMTAHRVALYREGTVEFALSMQRTIKKLQDTKYYAR